jgi:hypothetical protein
MIAAFERRKKEKMRCVAETDWQGNKGAVLVLQLKK